jgi:hypothetical protein
MSDEEDFILSDSDDDFSLDKPLATQKKTKLNLNDSPSPAKKKTKSRAKTSSTKGLYCFSNFFRFFFQIKKLELLINIFFFFYRKFNSTN